MPVKNGDKVLIEYEGSFEDGTVFDSSEKSGEPIEVEIGAKQVIKGFENALLGMEVGEEKEIILTPKEAYGDFNKDMVRVVPRDKLPEGDVKAGMMIGVQLPNGQQVGALVNEVRKEHIVIDLNHPLAGKTLKFKLKIVKIN